MMPVNLAYFHSTSFNILFKPFDQSSIEILQLYLICRVSRISWCAIFQEICGQDIKTSNFLHNMTKVCLLQMVSFPSIYFCVSFSLLATLKTYQRCHSRCALPKLAVQSSLPCKANINSVILFTRLIAKDSIIFNVPRVHNYCSS